MLSVLEYPRQLLAASSMFNYTLIAIPAVLVWSHSLYRIHHMHLKIPVVYIHSCTVDELTG